jgi:hypothetical protein
MFVHISTGSSSNSNLTNYRVLLEHIGMYALSRSAHEKADVFHAMLVTVGISIGARADLVLILTH